MFYMFINLNILRKLPRYSKPLKYFRYKASSQGIKKKVLWGLSIHLECTVVA